MKRTIVHFCNCIQLNKTLFMRHGKDKKVLKYKIFISIQSWLFMPVRLQNLL